MYPDNELFDIEWYYLPVLRSHADIEPKALIYAISNNPELFCHLLNLLFRIKNHESPQSSEGLRSNLFEILIANRLTIIPGSNENREFEPSKFVSWINQVKTLSQKDSMWPKAQSVIGGYLTRAPSDPEGLFIHKKIAEELNQEDNEEMRTGFTLGIINMYGFRSVDPTGEDRLKLARHWDSCAKAIDEMGYARFATSLRRISKSFESDAREDRLRHQLLNEGLYE